MVQPARVSRLPARLPRRLVQLYAGLVLYGVSIALMVRSSLGSMPWDVLHQGLAAQLGWSLGVVVIAVGAVVLLAWIPLRERPGIGTISNVIVIGLAVDAALAVLTSPSELGSRLAFAAAGIVLNGVATAAYIGVQLGPGPRDPAEVLALLDRAGSPAAVSSTGGRYFGYVNGGTDPAAGAAAVLAGAWDQNVALPGMSPVAAHLDELAARWAVELLGLPGTAIATFCSGASIANLTCVLAARDALLDRAGWSVDRQGLSAAPPLRVVASAEIHASVGKALRAAGIGRDAVVAAPTDDAGRVRVADFPEVDDRTLVLLQAGNVNTGHSDPFAELIPAAHERGAWVHVDGAFGLWAAASPAQRHLVAGAGLADSWATDAHKWLNAPYDSGLAICREPADLRGAMVFDAAYITSDSPRALAHLGLQMSQRARGVETWAVLAAQGRSGIAAMVDRMCDRAQQMADLLSAAGASVLVPRALNQVLVQFDDDATTDAVIAAVQRDRTCWAGGTVWQGRHAMRISVCDATTTSDDIVASAQAVLRCWAGVRS